MSLSGRLRLLFLGCLPRAGGEDRPSSWPEAAELSGTGSEDVGGGMDLLSLSSL